MDSQKELIAALRDPGFYPHHPREVEVRETHTSVVFLAGELVYKLKKAVRLGFLDYSSPEVRRRMCHEEVRLNRRLAPDMYLGVRSVLPGFALGEADRPDALDHLVEMRRYDERLELGALVVAGEVSEQRMRELGALIARFHADVETVVPDEDARLPVKRAADETFTSLMAGVEPSQAQLVLGAERFFEAALLAHGDEIRARAAAGRVRDGHGDLRAEHVVLGDPIEIVDCVEFDPALRHLDAGADLSFLVMDLHRLGAEEPAAELVAGYREAGGDPGSQALIALFAAQRAWVRAKVALLRAGQQRQAGEDAAASSAAARELLQLGRRFAWAARRPLVLVVCGLSGAGKTHLAAELSQVTGLHPVNSDVVRKRLAGVPAGEHAGPERYSYEFSERTYEVLGRVAAAEVERKGVAIVDATFRRRADRAAFQSAMEEAGCRPVFVECLAPLDVRLERVARRQAVPGQVSDADRDIAAGQTFDPLDEVEAGRHMPLRSDRDVGELVAAVEAWLDSTACT
jgi:aminoglycoside phosphotransferase family enzyme/predicted kinase